MSLFLDTQLEGDSKVEARFMFLLSSPQTHSPGTLQDGHPSQHKRVKQSGKEVPLKPWVSRSFDKEVKGGWGFSKCLTLGDLQRYLVNGDLYLKCYLEVSARLLMSVHLSG